MTDRLIPNLLKNWLQTSQFSQIESLQMAGGFSGAMFWRISTRNGKFCLRRWPKEHPTRERLEQIHSLLLHVERNGFTQIPTPQVTIGGETFVSRHGHFWELSAWLEGSADFHHRPTPPRLDAAMTSLARFHKAASSYPGCRPEHDRSPGLLARHAHLQQLLAGELEQIESHCRAADPTEFRTLAWQIVAMFRQLAPTFSRKLQDANRLTLPLQMVIRDIWHDHVLFRDNQVSGLIDFGALNVDTVAADIARLLGSLVQDDANAWRAGLAGYQAISRLTSEEIAAIKLFDQANVLLSGMQWLQWVYLRGRRFDDLAPILSRLRTNLARMQHLVTIELP